KTLFAIDQFVMRGGRVIVFQDPHNLTDRPEADPQNPWAAMQYEAKSNLNALLEKWGVRMAEGEIAMDRTLALSAPLQRNQAPRPIPAFMALTNANMAQGEPISANLQQVRVLFAGSLGQAGGDDAPRMTPLITTTENGTTWKPAS